MARTLEFKGTNKPFIRPKTREALTGWLFASPWIIGFLVFTVGPMIFSGYASLTRYNITTAPKWVGLDNYTTLFQDELFYKSLGNTLWIVLVKVPIVTVASIAIALLLNMELPGAKA